ncbi:MAG: DUF4136 domain-containing protein [bacterium]|nr:DUF4136 domain-containing protein [bacterium]
MKKLLSVTLFLMMAALLTSCGSSVSVNTDYDLEEDFSQLKTFQWLDERIPKNALDLYPLIKKRVAESVVNDLEAKGFVQDNDAPDFVVIAHAQSKEKMQVTDWGGGGYYRYDPWWGAYGGRVDVSYYDEGTLVLDIVRVETEEMIWRGIGKAVVREYSNPEKRQKAIDDTVATILKDFPPQAK